MNLTPSYALSSYRLRALSREAHRANQRAKTLSGVAQSSQYLVKDTILEHFLFIGAAKVNEISVTNLVSLNILCDRSQLHMPLECFSPDGQREVCRQVEALRRAAEQQQLRARCSRAEVQRHPKTIRRAASLGDRLPAEQLRRLRTWFDERATNAAQLSAIV